MKESKNYRTLDMFVRFCEGKTINKTEEARRFGVDERFIREMLSKRSIIPRIPNP